MFAPAIKLCLIVAMLLQPFAVGPLVVGTSDDGTSDIEESVCAPPGSPMCGGCGCCQVESPSQRCCCCKLAEKETPATESVEVSESSSDGDGQTSVLPAPRSSQVSACLCGRQHRPIHHGSGEGFPISRLCEMPLAFGIHLDLPIIRASDVRSATARFDAAHAPHFSQTLLSVWLI
jgi:hypothetical protein